MPAKNLIAIASCLFALSASAQTLNDAIKMTDNENFEKASSMYRQLIMKEPGNGDIYFWWGENSFRQDDLDSAETMYKTGYEKNPSNPVNLVGWGKVMWYQKKYEDAQKKFYDAEVLVSPKNKISTLTAQQKATVLMKIAEVYIKSEQKDLQKGITLLNQAIALDAKNPEIFLLVGDAELEKNPIDGSPAITQYKKAFELDKKSCKAILRIGQLYGRATNYQEAFKFYQDANKIDSAFAPAYREKAELYYRAKQYDQAIGQYKKYLQLNNNSCTARRRYVGFLYLAGKYEECLAEIAETGKTCGDDNLLNRLGAYCNYELGDKRKDSAMYKNGLILIEKFFEKADKKKILPSDYEYYGKLLGKCGNDSLAVEKLKIVLSLDTTRTELWGEIGSICMAKKKYPCAIEAYNNKIKGGKNVGANDYNFLGKSYYQTGQYGKADTAFIQVTLSNPDLGLGYLWRARSLQKMDDEKKPKFIARPMYEMYVQKIKPEDVNKYKKELEEAYSYLGYCTITLKEYSFSKWYWEKVKEINPTNAKVKTAFDTQELKGVSSKNPFEKTR